MQKIVVDEVRLNKDGQMYGILVHWSGSGRRFVDLPQKGEWTWVASWTYIGPDGYTKFTPMGEVNSEMLIAVLKAIAEEGKEAIPSIDAQRLQKMGLLAPTEEKPWTSRDK